MKHLFIRPESKIKGKLGRGNSIVAFPTKGRAAYSLIKSLLESYSYTADQFTIEYDGENDDGIIITAYNDHDYYRWLDVLNSNYHYIEIPQDDVLEGATVLGSDGIRYGREAVEILGYTEAFENLSAIMGFDLQLIRATVVEEKVEEVVVEPVIPLVQLVDYGNEYDLPSPRHIKSGSMLGRFFSFLGNLVTNDEHVGEPRKPFIVFESCLGGHIAIYQSTSTGNEVDVAFFSRYGELINVFSFQDGCPHVTDINGFTIEDLINISTWRILHLNVFLQADENVTAALHLNEAITNLNARANRRLSEQETTEEG